MFDFDAGKLVLFGIVALAVIPAKDLPRVLRTVGKYVGQMRRMAGEFQGQFMEAMKEAELEGVKQEIAKINEAARIETSFDSAGLMKPTPASPTPYESVTVAAPHVEPTPELQAEPAPPSESEREPLPAEPVHSASHAEPEKTSADPT